MDEASFIEEIRSDPSDITPRLIYADYLEDVGDPRGEFIRVQCELADSQTGQAGRDALFQREQQLLDEFGDEWLRPLRQLGAEGISRSSFERGLLERVRINAEQLLENGEELCRISPALQCLSLRKLQPFAADLAKFTLPSQIHAIDLSANQLEPDSLEDLSEANWLKQISSLDLRINRLADDGIAALVLGAWGVGKLNLGMNRIGPDGIRHLVGWHRYADLVELDLRMNRFGNPGLGFLVNGAALELQQLDLNTCEITSLQSLRTSVTFPSLRQLSLRNNRISAEELNWLAESKIGQQLQEIDTRNNGHIGGRY